MRNNQINIDFAMLLRPKNIYRNKVILPFGGKMYVKIPIQNAATEKIFRWNCARDLSMFLAKNPYNSYTVSEIINRLDIKSRDSLSKLLDAMKDAELIESVRVGRKRFISINSELIEMPKDSFSQIPQKEYRKIVKLIVSKIIKKKEVKKVILFGAMARGSADRMSDIDILVVGKNVSKLQDKLGKISYDAKSGKILPERFELNIRIITPLEFTKPRGFVKDALMEGILLFGE
jgi:predicted nucleotidyltransferase